MLRLLRIWLGNLGTPERGHKFLIALAGVWIISQNSPSLNLNLARSSVKAGLGQLSGGGFVFAVPLHLVRKLLTSECALLPSLGKNLQFEIAVGMNGRVWVRARTVRDTICLANAICAAEHMTNEEIKRMVAKLGDAMHGF